LNLQDIRTLYDYNHWANRRILNTAAKITPAQFIAPTNCSFGSLRGTLVHILDTEWGWRSVCMGVSTNGVILADDDFPTLASLQTRWEEEETAWHDYLGSLSEADLNGELRTGGERQRILWHVLFHVVNHGMQHRSEAAAMLTDFGQSPGDIDFTVFLNNE
jgi:uncharacterized damage-inducible protein DinB